LDINTPLDQEEAVAWLRNTETTLLRKITAATWLIDEGLDSATIGRRIGQSASTVRHWSRLLHKLSAPVLERLTRPLQFLSIGHLKAIAALPAAQQLLWLERCLAHHYSVRRLETLVQNTAGMADPSDETHYARLSEHLSLQLGFETVVRPSRGRRGAGKVTLSFQTLNEFDALCTRLRVDLSDL
jgi:hypothetical protein